MDTLSGDQGVRAGGGLMTVRPDMITKKGPHLWVFPATPLGPSLLIRQTSDEPQPRDILHVCPAPLETVKVIKTRSCLRCCPSPEEPKDM